MINPLKITWATVPNNVRCYAALSHLISSVAVSSSLFIHRVVYTFENEVGIHAYRQRIAKLLKPYSDAGYMTYIDRSHVVRGNRCYCECWFVTKAPLSDSEKIDLEGAFASSFAWKDTSAEVNVDRQAYDRPSIERMFGHLDDKKSEVMCSRSTINGAVGYLYSQLSSEAKKPAEPQKEVAVEEQKPSVDELGKMFAELEERAAAKPTKSPVEEKPGVLLRKSAALFGQAVSIYTRQLTVKLREQMTSHAHFRRMS